MWILYRARLRHNDHGKYSSTSTSESYYYEIDLFSTSSVEYRGFEYYHHGVDIAQPLPPYYSDDGSSSQLSQPTDQINIRAIILMKTIYLISLLITGMIMMMILCLIANSMWK